MGTSRKAENLLMMAQPKVRPAQSRSRRRPERSQASQVMTARKMNNVTTKSEVT